MGVAGKLRFGGAAISQTCGVWSHQAHTLTGVQGKNPRKTS